MLWRLDKPTLPLTVVSRSTWCTLCLVPRSCSVTECTSWTEIFVIVTCTQRTVWTGRACLRNIHTSITSVSTTKVTRQCHVLCIQIFIITCNNKQARVSAMTYTCTAISIMTYTVIIVVTYTVIIIMTYTVIIIMTYTIIIIMTYMVIIVKKYIYTSIIASTIYRIIISDIYWPIAWQKNPIGHISQ